ncbi:glycoside hydrolase family 2 protein [Acutalibacter intestini]|uniref:glycoside hydrolase family 2 protein n=1 Tax=Acutalibacter intestini TaxID=3093659 RepID=UPI002AC9B0C9|nr:sugar-binding domain-containing protein [Acutalibacter sp. M00204]
MYRAEHPNPQFFREQWENLNGQWEFDFDFGMTGKERGLFDGRPLDKTIQVPFCPESRLSGIGHTDFMNCVWYRRSFTVPAGWQDNGRVLLHFGAVDYEATVYINGKEAGSHTGGYTSFQLDVTSYLNDGENVLTLCALDDSRKTCQPSGKQSHSFASQGCFYTRTTGIWQTVWLEHVPESHIKTFRFYPDVKNGRMLFEVYTTGGGQLDVAVSYQGKPMGGAALSVEGDVVRGEVVLAEKHLWELGQGRLYDVALTFGEDRVQSYFGLREVKLDGFQFLLNGRSVFQRMVLDQGFYPDGIYTAPREEDLVQDIRLSMEAGFNGARLHERVFEPRFLYHCDKMGYMVWGEYANWGLDHSLPENLAAYISQWKEAMERDFNHPAIIGWCPFNETWDGFGRQQWNPLLATVYHITKALDPTRPCIDTSGNYHVVTDIFDVHDYDQNPETFAPRFARIREGILENHCNNRQTYRGEPVFVSEYGGISRASDKDKGWGYGDSPEDDAAFIQRYTQLTEALLDNPYIMGFCYTQLYDVEQEVNGLYTYGREPKFDMEVIRKVNQKKAAIEK